MSPDKDQEYFADGLSDTLIHVLEADVRAQRQWYEENKDKPLF